MEGLLEEYKTLRDEIHQNSELSARTFIFTVTVTATLIGAGLAIGFWAIFLSPFAIIIPGMYFLSSQLESTTRIASYIQIRIEPKLEGLKWETEWLRLREENLMPHTRKYTLSISGLYGGLGIICLILSWIYLFTGNNDTTHLVILSVATAIILVLIILASLCMRHAFSPGFVKKYNDAWKSLD